MKTRSKFPAHIRINTSEERQIQTVEEHLQNVSEGCKQILEAVGLPATGELAGLLHDMGKYTDQFAEYICAAADGKPVARGSVNHTFAGARRVLTDYHLDVPGSAEDVMQNLTAELLALVIGSHHGQFDCCGEDGGNGFNHRLETEICYDEAYANFDSFCAGRKKVDLLFEQSVSELTKLHLKIQKDEVYIGYSFLYRLVLSALIEADRSDTAAFMADIDSSGKDGTASVWAKQLSLLEDKINRFPKDSSINRARYDISQMAGNFAAAPTGIYRMNVPTGGGKTLSSFRAALAHAAQNGKKRIVFAIPLLSVLEQNAKVIEDVTEDRSLILEHHSNAVSDREEGECLNENELITENWHAPIVITTLVQLLNTLFEGKTSCIRRMHALIDSVIVIDEVQSVPRKMVSLFNKAVNFLAEVCNCTVILCSATQPCFQETDRPMNRSEDIIPYSETLWKSFRRTELVNHAFPPMSMEELSDFAIDRMQTCGSVLVVCNKKKQACDLYHILKEQGICAVHLSTAMCMQHRISAMNRVKQLLKEKTPFVCVSTQLMEAGVDLSFACSVRLLAGLDNLIQTAGRCNRNGEFGSVGYSYCVRLQPENLSHVPEIKESQDAMIKLLSAYSEKDFGPLDSEKCIHYFYRKLTDSEKRGFSEFFVKEYETTVFSMLSDNKEFSKKEKVNRYFFRQAFRTAGESFAVFDSLTTDVLVPYGEGETLIAEFQSERASYDLKYRKELLKRSKLFTVSVYDWQKQELLKENALYSVCNGSALALSPDYYDSAVGITKDKKSEFMEI